MQYLAMRVQMCTFINSADIWSGTVSMRVLRLPFFSWEDNLGEGSVYKWKRLVRNTFYFIFYVREDHILFLFLFLFFIFYVREEHILFFLVVAI